jgi:hypothetical protein
MHASKRCSPEAKAGQTNCAQKSCRSLASALFLGLKTSYTRATSDAKPAGPLPVYTHVFLMGFLYVWAPTFELANEIQLPCKRISIFPSIFRSYDNTSALENVTV